MDRRLRQKTWLMSRMEQEIDSGILPIMATLRGQFMIAAQSRPPALAALGVFVKPQEREVNVRLAYPRKPRPREMVKPNIKQWFTVWYRYDDSYYPPRVIEFPNLEHEDLTDWLHITYHRVVAERPT
jgi:hypothetical protein